ncbi:hypothetical protein PYW07_009928 [Mythimna separata]|uniref:SCP domain-containing protein n=1 Tax=Mythimna separata TaxID=271217 RepID=A0AAD7YI35_MYTSE|nr:hypothetical protein PYW07_009928 [Mythimna separata]
MFFKIIALVFIITKSMRCSIVHEDLKQNLNVNRTSKDCPLQRHCKKGTHHVMCTYPNQLYGPRCEDPVKVEVTPNMVHHILTNVNYLRGRIANGTETGSQNKVLPKAYGLIKLEWDKELALSAQVLANQCLEGKKDECRATERFPKPSQMIAVIRYKYPNWEYLKSNSTEKGLDEIKLIFAVDKLLKFSHSAKINVTKDILRNCPHMKKIKDVNLKHYLYLIHDGVTHVGCGVSAYTSRINDTDTETKQNTVQIVCNFSAKPKRSQPVYNMVPPIPDQGFSKRCGCPKGYRETNSCLCERGFKNHRKGLPFKNQISFKKDGRRSMNNRLKTGVLSSEEEEGETNSQQSTPIIILKSRNVIIPPSVRKNLQHVTKTTIVTFPQVPKRGASTASRPTDGANRRAYSYQYEYPGYTTTPNNYYQKHRYYDSHCRRGQRCHRGGGGGYYNPFITVKPPRRSLLSRLIEKIKTCFNNLG